MRQTFQKYISSCVVLVLLGVTSPAFAGDFVNLPLPHGFAFYTQAAAPSEYRVPLPSSLLFAIPQAGQTPNQSQPVPVPQSQAGQGELSGKGVAFKWVGIFMMIGGGGLIARGATLSNPCAAFSGPYVSCSSNYTTVRAASFGLGGALAVTGAVLLAIHNRFRR